MSFQLTSVDRSGILNVLRVSYECESGYSEGKRVSRIDIVEQHQDDHCISANIQIMFPCFERCANICGTLRVRHHN